MMNVDEMMRDVENIRNGLIFYSLGNLASDQSEGTETRVGWIADVLFAGERIAGYGVIPLEIMRIAPRVHSPIPSLEPAQ